MGKTLENYDVIIVGGGLAGLTLACLLGRHNFSVLCLDRDGKNNSAAARATVLSHGTSLVLKEAGLWDAIEPLACPIHKIDILDGPSPVLMNFLSEEVAGKAFGHNIENYLLLDILAQRAAKLKTVTHIANAEVSDVVADQDKITLTLSDHKQFSATLAVGADGRQSFMRNFIGTTSHGWTYDQTAIVAIFDHENPHGNTAIEHFRREGPLAVLPLTDSKNRHRSTIVWTVETRNAKSLLAMPDEVFITALTARLPESYGAIRSVSPRLSYPLSLAHAHNYAGTRVALIGDAGHGMHPIAGQGLNMGMRDIKALTDILIEARNQKKDFGSGQTLKKYETARRADNTAMMAATDALNKLFSNNLPLLAPLRRLGISLISRSPSAKGFLMKQAMGLNKNSSRKDR